MRESLYFRQGIEFQALSYFWSLVNSLVPCLLLWVSFRLGYDNSRKLGFDYKHVLAQALSFSIILVTVVFVPLALLNPPKSFDPMLLYAALVALACLFFSLSSLLGAFVSRHIPTQTAKCNFGKILMSLRVPLALLLLLAAFFAAATYLVTAYAPQMEWLIGPRSAYSGEYVNSYFISFLWDIIKAAGLAAIPLYYGYNSSKKWGLSLKEAAIGSIILAAMFIMLYALLQALESSLIDIRYYYGTFSQVSHLSTILIVSFVGAVLGLNGTRKKSALIQAALWNSKYPLAAMLIFATAYSVLMVFPGFNSDLLDIVMYLTTPGWLPILFYLVLLWAGYHLMQKLKPTTGRLLVVGAFLGLAYATVISIVASGYILNFTTSQNKILSYYVMFWMSASMIIETTWQALALVAAGGAISILKGQKIAKAKKR
jgi:hypothetical protein